MQEKKSIQIVEFNGQLVVDSRLVAQDLGITHKNFKATIDKYKAETEQDFGSLLFETEVKKRSVGATTQGFYYLSEDQATYLMTLSKNTAKVRNCKRDLVKKFSEAKKLLEKYAQPEQPKPKTTADMLIEFALAFKEHEERISTIESESVEIKQQLAEQQETIESTAMLAEANAAELQRFKNGHGY